MVCENHTNNQIYISDVHSSVAKWAEDREAQLPEYREANVKKKSVIDKMRIQHVVD